MTIDSATMKSKLNLLETSLSVRNRMALGLYRYKDFPHWIPFYSGLDKFHWIIISNVQKKKKVQNWMSKLFSHFSLSSINILVKKKIALYTL